jgi:hypothetical protein
MASTSLQEVARVSKPESSPESESERSNSGSPHPSNSPHPSSPGNEPGPSNQHRTTGGKSYNEWTDSWVAGPSHQSSQVAGPSRHLLTRTPAPKRGRADPSSSSLKLGIGYIEEGDGHKCILDPAKCERTFPSGTRLRDIHKHLGTYTHRDGFAYIPHHLVFKTDIVISVIAPGMESPNAPCVFGTTE